MLTIINETNRESDIITFRNIPQGSIFKFKDASGLYNHNSFCLKVGGNKAVNLQANPPTMIGTGGQGFLDEGTQTGRMDCPVALFEGTLTIKNI